MPDPPSSQAIADASLQNKHKIDPIQHGSVKFIIQDGKLIRVVYEDSDKLA